jgi:hypothetical protein
MFFDHKILILLFLLFVLPFISLSQVLPARDSLGPADTIADRNLSDTIHLSKREKNIRKYIPDTIFLISGDRIAGKILSFEQGRLSIDAQAAGVISVKWNKIASINGGNRIFKVEDILGEIYIGKIAASPDKGEILVLSKLKYGLMLENIVRIFPLESEWYRGIKGDLGGGISYTKSSDVLRLNAEYNLYYIISKWRLINNFSYIETTTNDEEPTIRVDLDLELRYALRHRWLLSEINSFNRNDELGIKSRFSIGVAGGNSFVQTDRQRLLFLTGILQNAEKDVDTKEVSTNTEWPFYLEHTVYSFIKPDLSTTTSVVSYVGITDKGRYRLDASTDITWEFVKNFKLQLSVYYNYDNKNLEGKNSKKDYGTVFSLLLNLR